MENLNPIIFSSKAASDHLGNIRTQHDIILEGLKNQAMKVSAYEQNVALQQEKKSLMDAQAQKEQAEMTRKQKELDIKAAALNL